MAVDAFMARGAELFANAADAANENPIEGLLLFVDALTMGLVSGTAEGIAQREERFWEEPGLYNFLNALSFGGLDLVDEVINPEEPWSFAHIMNTIALVTLLYGVGKLDKPSEGKKRANTAADLKPQDLMDELARSGVKYNPDEVIAVIRALDGKLMWLEKGNSKSGLTHILEKHADDFASLGKMCIRDSSTPICICFVIYPIA